MLSRPSLRASRRAAQCLQCGQRRGLAAPASGSFAYQTSDANGVKFASRDMTGPTTTLALVSKAGSRFQTLPGLAEGLEKFAFKVSHARNTFAYPFKQFRAFGEKTSTLAAGYKEREAGLTEQEKGVQEQENIELQALNTERRSALRICREVELLGGEITAYHGRENLVLGARFLREDLPYFVELLAEAAGQTKYQPYIYAEEITEVIKLSHKKFLASPSALADASVHGVAFHRGLGTPVYPSSSIPISKYLSADSIADYATAAYSKSNFAVVANGADHGEFTKWMGEFFKGYSVSAGSSSSGLSSPQTKYYGGEERIAHGTGNVLILGFSGSSSYTGGFYKPEIQVLASLLGGQSSIKWSPGFSLLGKAGAKFPGASIKTKSEIYSDAGLLTITFKGSAKDVAGAAHEAVKSLKAIAGGQVSSEDIKKAIANAKFKELEFGQNVNAALELTGAGLVHEGKAYQIDETAKAIEGVTEGKVKEAAKTLLEHNASVSAVGDLFVLPYAEELGLKV